MTSGVLYAKFRLFEKILRISDRNKARLKLSPAGERQKMPIRIKIRETNERKAN